jgi:TolB-like protein
VSDVFISYAKKGHSQADQLAQELQAKGFSVWYDTSLVPGDSFRDVIVTKLAQAKAAIVIWDQSSVKSDWVYSEADRARARRILIPVRTEDVSSRDIPPPFDCLHTELVSNRTAIEIALSKLGVLPVARSLQPAADFADTRAVAVLPFDNLSSDPGEGYFVDGLTEDIITALAYWRWFPVVARNSTFAYKGKPKNAKEIGRELEAAYLVEGSARRSEDQFRITVQLIETATGHHLFAERYNRAMADVFVVQEEIAERIVASIEPEIHRAETRRAARKHPSDLGAWDHALKALSLQERMTPACHEEAREHLKLALDLDPTSARAWSLLSLCHYHEGILGWVTPRGDALRASLEAAEQAVACDDGEWLAQGLWGMGRMWTERDFSSALDGTERAVALNPSAPLARHMLACILEFSGRPAEALPHLEAILRLDPRYRFRSLAIADQSLCHLLLGNFDEAISLADKAVRAQPANVRARQRLVAALNLRGQGDKARAAAVELSRLQASLDVAYIDDTYPFLLPHERDLFLGALRASGLLQT